MKYAILALLLSLTTPVQATSVEKRYAFTQEDCKALVMALNIVAAKEKNGVPFDSTMASLYRPELMERVAYRASLWNLVFSANKFYEMPDMDSGKYITRIAEACRSKVGKSTWPYYE